MPPDDAHKWSRKCQSCQKRQQHCLAHLYVWYPCIAHTVSIGRCSRQVSGAPSPQLRASHFRASQQLWGRTLTVGNGGN